MSGGYQYFSIVRDIYILKLAWMQWDGEVELVGLVGLCEVGGEEELVTDIFVDRRSKAIRLERSNVSISSMDFFPLSELSKNLLLRRPIISAPSDPWQSDEFTSIAYSTACETQPDSSFRCSYNRLKDY